MGQSRGILQGTHQQFLLSANFSYSSILGQSVGHITKRCLNGLLILCEDVLPLGLFKIDIRLESTSRKDRLRDLGNESPGATGPAKQIRQRIALKSKGACKTDGWKVGFLCGRDESIFGDQKLFSRSDIRASLEQRGRQSGRD